MVQQTLSLWGNGAVTLPKEWRDQFPTTHFMAIELPEGLLIKPIVEIEYYEKEDEVGLRFPMGMKPSRFLELMDEAEKALSRASAKKKTKRKRSHG